MLVTLTPRQSNNWWKQLVASPLVALSKTHTFFILVFVLVSQCSNQLRTTDLKFNVYPILKPLFCMHRMVSVVHRRHQTVASGVILISSQTFGDRARKKTTVHARPHTWGSFTTLTGWSSVFTDRWQLCSAARTVLHPDGILNTPTSCSVLFFFFPQRLL